MIYDKEELKWFLNNIVPDLKQEEVYFVSLSARNKYLTKEEREYYSLGRTEMFGRKLIKNKEVFINKLNQLLPIENRYFTKNNKSIPKKAVIIYFNINPSSSLKAYNMFNKIMNEYMFELGQCSINNRSVDNIINRIRKQDTLLMNCYQKAKGTRHWIDFDFDVDKEFLPYIKNIVNEINENNGKAYIIDTKSGFHLLVNKDTKFTNKFNPKTIVDNSEKELISMYKEKYEGNELFEKMTKYEIIINSNAMIPLPGTLQGNYKVKVLNK